MKLKKKHKKLKQHEKKRNPSIDMKEPFPHQTPFSLKRQTVSQNNKMKRVGETVSKSSSRKRLRSFETGLSENGK